MSDAFDFVPNDPDPDADAAGHTRSRGNNVFGFEDLPNNVVDPSTDGLLDKLLKSLDDTPAPEGSGEEVTYYSHTGNNGDNSQRIEKLADHIFGFEDTGEPNYDDPIFDVGFEIA